MATALALTIRRDRDDQQGPGLARLSADGIDVWHRHLNGFIGDAEPTQSHD